ncbi:glycosyltransferase family protein [Endothiovibrio diazotrophicus]
MNYRICRITFLAHRDSFELIARAAGEGASYQELQQRFFDHAVIYSDGFSRAMEALGNETLEILCNAGLIQKRWARENGVKYDDHRWLTDIMLAQIEAFRPEVIYLQGADPYWAEAILTDDLRQRFPFVRLVVGYVGHLMDCAALGSLDLVLVNEPCMAERFRQAGIEARTLYHSFDPKVLERVARWRADGHGKSAEVYDFTFLGSSGFGFGETHMDRYWALIDLLLSTRVSMWLYERGDVPALREQSLRHQSLAEELAACVEGDSATALTTLRDIHVRRTGSLTPVVPLASIFPERCSSPFYGVEYFDVVMRSRLNFNIHPSNRRCAGNIRLFEVTGVGGCLVNNEAENLAELFVPDAEVVTYGSVEECREKVSYLLDHEAERRAIAEAGRKRTLRDHTVDRRCDELHRLLSEAL